MLVHLRHAAEGSVMADVKQESPPPSISAISRPQSHNGAAVKRLTRALPPEIEFLAQHEASADRMLRVLDTSPGGVEPLDALLAEGMLSEEQYYQALARRLGCAYFDGEPPFAPHFDVVKSLRSGVAPLDGGLDGPRAVIAPRASLVSRLIAMRFAGRLHPNSFAVASPQRFAALVRMRRGDEVLAGALARIPDSLSARRGISSAQIAVAGLIAVLAIALGLMNAQALAGVASLALWLLFSASLTLRSAAAIAYTDPVRPAPLSDDDLPIYTIVVPVFREANVIADLVMAIEAIDYPKGKLDIKLVAERRDSDTLSRIAGMRLPTRYELVVAPPGEPSTKPRALNIALTTARGKLLVVYDAEDAPSPGQLRLAAARFAADRSLDCLQARLAIRNPGDSWLSKLFAVEYAVLFDLINPGLCALRLPIALGGTSNHFRLASLIAVGGWDEWNVAEDADLGIRLARRGLKIGSLSSDTSEEAPHELGNWFRQRVRWQKGWMQTTIVHARKPARFVTSLGTLRAVSAATLIIGSILSALLWPAFALDTLVRALEAGRDKSAWREATDVFTYILALGGIWALALPAIVACKLRRLDLTVKDLALALVYYLLVSLAAWTAILDLVARPHYWAKTEHGRTRGGSAHPASAEAGNRVERADAFG